MLGGAVESAFSGFAEAKVRLKEWADKFAANRANTSTNQKRR